MTFHVTVTFLSDADTASDAMDEIIRQLPDDLEWHYMSAGITRTRHNQAELNTTLRELFLHLDEESG